MERFVVGIDADGVLTDMSKFNLEEGRKFFKKEPVNPDAYESSEMFGISKFQKNMFGLKVLDKYCRKTPLRDDAKEVITKMSEEGAELHEITARMFTTIKGPFGGYYRRLFRNYLKDNELSFKSIQFCSETDSPRDKYMACLKLGVDVMIEDKPEVALYLAERGIKILLFDAPYNKGIEGENLIRVKSWQDCYTEYRKLREAKEVIPEYKRLSKDERQGLTKEEQVKYIKSYHAYVKKLNVNEEALKKSEKRFKLMYYVTLLPFSIMFRSKKEGLENIPYQDGFIIASNHLDWRDQFFISRALGNRQFCGFAAESIRNTIRGKMFDFSGGAVFIDRKDDESKRKGEEELALKIANDKIGLIFPEGTRKNKNEEGKKIVQLPFKLGTVSLAQKTGAAILPVSLYHGHKYSYLKIGELQFVTPEDDLLEANEKLSQKIKTMTLSSMEQDKK